MHKKKIRIKWKNIILLIIIIGSLTCLTFSIINIIKYKIEETKTNEQVNIIEENIIIEDVPDEDEETEIVEQEEEIPETSPYWAYINMNLIDVDFSELKHINNDVKGWIQVNGTNINYPFVQKKIINFI